MPRLNTCPFLPITHPNACAHTHTINLNVILAYWSAKAFKHQEAAVVVSLLDFFSNQPAMSSARLAHHVTYIHRRPPPNPDIPLLASYHGNRLRILLLHNHSTLPDSLRIPASIHPSPTFINIPVPPSSPPPQCSHTFVQYFTTVNKHGEM